jgi:hypothetical protein
MRLLIQMVGGNEHWISPKPQKGRKQMAMLVKEVKQWLDTLPDDAVVGIDDGGLTLVCFDDRITVDFGPVGQAYIEVGGLPDEGTTDA